MLRVAGLNVPLCADADARACALALKKLRLTQQDIASWRVAKHSVDARDRGVVHFMYAVDLTQKQDEAAFLRRLKPGTAALAAPDAPLAPPPAASRAHAPVVVGMGPAACLRRCIWPSRVSIPSAWSAVSAWISVRGAYSAFSTAARWMKTATCSSARAARARFRTAS